MPQRANTLRNKILDRMNARAPFGVWTPVDFIDLASRVAVDQTLHRLVRERVIRRVARGLYDKPALNSLTAKETIPDPGAVIEAISRRDGLRVLVDGMTAANDLGLSDAVPARILVHTDARLRKLVIGTLPITFKQTAPSKLYWAGRPAMRVVQALHWLKDTLETEQDQIVSRLRKVLANPRNGDDIRNDLRAGQSAMPDWMRTFLKDLIGGEPDPDPVPVRPGRRRTVK